MKTSLTSQIFCELFNPWRAVKTKASSLSQITHRGAIALGVDGIIVDWECHQKKARQAGADTQINRHTLADLISVRSCTGSPIICRINGFGPTTDVEIEQAIDSGANEILLPMVRTVREVETVLNRVAGRCDVGILIETVAATYIAGQLSALPIKRVYVGLNDLSIERRSQNIFIPLVDGLLESIRGRITRSFGFGGLTLPNCGFPIPCSLLMGEMARLDCHFSFLRRAFHNDIAGRDLGVEISNIRAALKAAAERTNRVVEYERKQLSTAIQSWITRREKIRSLINADGFEGKQENLA